MATRLHITDHVVLRYLERVEGVDVQAIRRKIARLVQMAEDHPGCNAVNAANIHFEIRGGAVVTCFPQNEPDRRTKRRRT